MTTEPRFTMLPYETYTALEALDALAKSTGLGSNMATRAWMTAGCILRHDEYGARHQLGVMLLDRRFAALSEHAWALTDRAVREVQAWADWVDLCRAGVPCTVCEQPDYEGDRDNLGVCRSCREAAAEAGVAIRIGIQVLACDEGADRAASFGEEGFGAPYDECEDTDANGDDDEF